MSSAGEHRRAASTPAPVPITPLLPPGPPAGAAELVERFGLWERGGPAAELPKMLLNMVSSADGRATLAGRSAPLSSAADRELFHALRTPVDAVLAGAGTVRAERYGELVPDPVRRLLREQRGLPPEPLACVATTSVALDPELPLFAAPDARVVLLTPSQATLDGARARIDYIRAGAGRTLDLRAALAELRARFGVELVLCEGGPHLAGELLAAGALDELFLSLAPVIAGTDPEALGELRIVAGATLDPAVTLELLSVLASGSHLFLRYRVASAERVSRETIESSSLAR